MRPQLARVALALSLALPSALAAGCGRSPELPRSIELVQTPTRPTFTVTGTAQLDVSPDCADLTLTISGEAPRTGPAAAAAREHQTALLGRLAALKVAKEDLKLSSLRIDPVIEYLTDGRQRSKGFRAETRVVVTTRDFEQIEAIMDAAAASGVTQMSTAFRSEKLDEVKRRLRDLALDAAAAKAKQMTSKLGTSPGAVVGIAEQSGGSLWSNAYFPPANLPKLTGDATPGALTTAEAQTLTLEVSVTYQLPTAG
ncbi:MAG TPA: SIMPL domain-containing protein [Kofleriaceae bacterium]|nr:SIMPL domain-containing protein [Kofleriaceae bacterium]